MVMEKVLSNVTFLEMLSPDEIKIFSMRENNARLVGFKLGIPGPDLSNDKELDVFFSDTNKVMSHKPKLYEFVKDYKKTRAEEAFFLIENGATITNSSLYDFIDSLIKKN